MGSRTRSLLRPHRPAACSPCRRSTRGARRPAALTGNCPSRGGRSLGIWGQTWPGSPGGSTASRSAHGNLRGECRGGHTPGGGSQQGTAMAVPGTGGKGKAVRGMWDGARGSRAELWGGYWGGGSGDRTPTSVPRDLPSSPNAFPQWAQKKCSGCHVWSRAVRTFCKKRQGEVLGVAGGGWGTRGLTSRTGPAQ